MHGAALLEDPEGVLSFDQVRASKAFRPVRGPVENLGYPDSVYWLRVSVQHESERSEVWLFEVAEAPDRVELHRVQQGQHVRQLSGRALRFSERPTQFRRIVFRVPLGPGERSTLYLRYDTGDSLVVAPVMYTQEAYARQQSREVLAQGLYYGVIFVMALYNLFVFFGVRDRAYLYYVLFQVSFGMTQLTLDQIAYEFLWPNAVVWSQRAATFFAGLSFVGALGFGRTYLEVKDTLPRVDRVFAVFLSIAIGITLLAPWVTSALLNQVSLVFLITGSLLLIGTGVLAWKRGSGNAPIFTVAWLLLLTGSVVFSIRSMGLLPASALTDYALKVGSAIEATLLSLGLAGRINRLRREREQARQQVIENQEEHQRQLEQRVEDRTRELATALDELKAAQAQLVHQGRMASLGHLAAGVAHEIGNPLNFALGGAEVAADQLDALKGNLAKARPGSELTVRVQALERALSLVQQGTQRISTIVEHLREYVQSGKVEQAPTDVVDGIESTLRLLAARLDAHGIAVETDLPDELPMVSARAGELNQVFMNLLVNALQAMPDGGTLRIRARVESGTVTLRFADTGPGVPEAIRENIFDTFFTTRQAGEGTGLGLAISLEIVRQHGGSLWLGSDDDTAEDEGAVFWIELPASDAESGA